MTRNFLVVASNARVREALAGPLRSLGYSVTRAASGKEATTIARSVAVDVLLVESGLTDMSSEVLIEEVRKARPDCRTVVVTDFEQVRNTPDQLRYGQDDYLLASSQIIELLHAPYVAAREGAASAQQQRGTDALVKVIDVLVGLIELDQRFFGGFTHQVMEFARAVAEELSSDFETVREVTIATLLRDIGRIGVDADVLAEQGVFSEEQRQSMRGHVESTLRLFESIDFPWKVQPIIRHHHERYDGQGYPEGLRGREIPLGARIIAVVDAYVALTSGREHRPALDPEEALKTLISESGRQFDPEVVEAFQRVLDQRRAGRKKRSKPKILIVEAQEDFRKLVKMHLLNEGLKVVEARGYETAMGLLLKDPPDLVLVDLDASPPAAFQMLDEIREDESLRRIPFAFLSRSSDRTLKIRALRQGVDEFLDKDGDVEVFVARVENVLTREAIRRDPEPTRIRRGITGDLESLDLPDIVQTLVMGMKTACVTLNCEDETGRIWFENGTAKHASTGQLEGEPAFFEMIRWSRGEFVIEHGVRSSEHSVHHDAMFLLMEGLRLFDESKNDGAQAAS